MLGLAFGVFCSNVVEKDQFGYVRSFFCFSGCRCCCCSDNYYSCCCCLRPCMCDMKATQIFSLFTSVCGFGCLNRCHIQQFEKQVLWTNFLMCTRNIELDDKLCSKRNEIYVHRVSPISIEKKSFFTPRENWVDTKTAQTQPKQYSQC